MTIIDELQNIWSLLLFKSKTYSQVAKSKEAIYYAFGFVILFPILAFLLNMYLSELKLPFSIWYYLLFVVIMAPILSLLLSAVFHAVALLFKGTGSVLGLFKVMGYFAWLGILSTLFTYIDTSIFGAEAVNNLYAPFSIILSIYSVFLNVYIIKEVENLSVGRAISVFLIPIISFIILSLALIFWLMTILPPSAV